MNGTPRELDVSALPDSVRSPAAISFWAVGWGSAAAASLLACAVAVVLDLRAASRAWPPANVHGPLPFLPLLGLAILLGSLVPAVVADRAAKRRDLSRVRWSLPLVALAGVAALVVRWRELAALDFRWDSHAYGGAVFLLYGIHGLLLLAGALEIVVIPLRFLRNDVTKRELVDARSGFLLWTVVVASWAVLAPLLAGGAGWGRP